MHVYNRENSFYYVNKKAMSYLFYHMTTTSPPRPNIVLELCVGAKAIFCSAANCFRQDLRTNLNFNNGNVVKKNGPKFKNGVKFFNLNGNIFLEGCLTLFSDQFG